jgi:hypothetical protein
VIGDEFSARGSKNVSDEKDTHFERGELWERPIKPCPPPSLTPRNKGGTLRAPSGFSVAAFAAELAHRRISKERDGFHDI